MNAYGVDEDYFRDRFTKEAEEYAPFLYPNDEHAQYVWKREFIARQVRMYCYPSYPRPCPCCGRP